MCKWTKPSFFMKFSRFRRTVFLPATRRWVFESLTIMALMFCYTFLFTSMRWVSILHRGEFTQHADPEWTRGSDQSRDREHTEASAVCQALPTTGARHNRRDEFINGEPASHKIPKVLRNVMTGKGLFGIESLSLTCLVFCVFRNAV